MKNATLNDVIELSRACSTQLHALEIEKAAEKTRLNRPGHVRAIDDRIERVTLLQARVDAWALEIESAPKLPDGMRKYRVCMSWGSREEGTFEEIFTARDAGDAERQCREAMAASEATYDGISDDARITKRVAERVAQTAARWYLIHCLPEESR